jgi:hypothetical protein
MYLLWTLWQAWLAPHPLPPLLRYAELAWGGGGSWRAGSCLGILSGGGGLLWQVYSAGWEKIFRTQVYPLAELSQVLQGMLSWSMGCNFQ